MSIRNRVMTRYRAPSSPALRVARQWPPCGAARLDLASSKAHRHTTPPGGHWRATRPASHTPRGPPRYCLLAGRAGRRLPVESSPGGGDVHNLPAASTPWDDASCSSEPVRHPPPAQTHAGFDRRYRGLQVGMNGLVTARAFAPGSVGNIGVGFDLLGHTIDGVRDVALVRRIDEPTVRIRAIRGDSTLVNGGGVDTLPLDAARNTAGQALIALRAH